MITMHVLAFGVGIVGIVVSLAVSAALSVGAALILGTNKQKQMIDNSPPILTERGSALTLLIGRRRIPGFLCWAGDRQTKGSGGGKGFGGGSGATTYSERGWHVLCVGPASRLQGIYENGNAIWTGDISPDDSPSGTHLSTDTGDAFIYWGECDQPHDSVLAAALGTTSSWPCICYVFWNRKSLGGQATWPVIEYDLTVGIMDPVLADSDPWMDEISEGDTTDGPNAAHILWQFLTGPAPYGCAVPPDRLDGAAFEALGVILQDEHQPSHVLANNGVDARDFLAQILVDLGVMLPQVGDVLVPMPIRHVDATDIPEVTDDMLVTPGPPVREQVHDPALPDRLMFVIKARVNNFRDMDLLYDDASQAALRSRTKQQRVDMATVTDLRTGWLVAYRRSQELLTNTEKYQMDVAPGAARLRPGQAFILSGYGQLRVASIERRVGSRVATVQAVLDQYSGEPGTYVPSNIDDVFSPPAVEATPDVIVRVQEVPYALSATPAIAVLRVRANAGISGAAVWLSADGTSYTAIGFQNVPAAGGELQTALDASARTIIDQGPVFTAYNSDVDQVEDLSSREADWRTGAQLALIGDEIFFLRNITAVTGGWRLDGMIRARYDTDRQTHAAGSPVLLCSAAALRKLASPLIQANTTRYVKTQPTTNSKAADLSAVTPVSLAISSLKSLRPLPPDNFVANLGTNEYSTGNDIGFGWTYRVRDGQGRAAGELGAGNAIGAGTPTRDGNFRVRIRTDDMARTLKRTIDVSDDTGAVVYANADLVSDFAGEPASFVAEMADVLSSYESVTRTVVVTKV